MADDEDVSCDDLKNTFEELVQFRIDPTKPYAGSNIKSKILVVNNGDPVPMEQFFHDDDIIKAMVSNEQRCKFGAPTPVRPPSRRLGSGSNPTLKIPSRRL